MHDYIKSMVRYLTDPEIDQIFDVVYPCHSLGQIEVKAKTNLGCLANSRLDLFSVIAPGEM